MTDIKVQLQQAIIAEQFPWIDEVFVVNIPPEKVNEINETQLLITNINNELVDFGNNDFARTKSLIQVQIYFSKTANINFDEATNQLVHFFIAKNGYHSNGYSYFTDPDTNQISVTIKMDKII